MTENNTQHPAVAAAKKAGVSVEPKPNPTAADVMMWYHTTKNPPALLEEHHRIFADVYARLHLCTVRINGKPITDEQALAAQYPPETVQAVMAVTEPIINVVFPKPQ